MADCLLGNVNDNYKGICVKIINFFIGKGFTPAQALGICANVYQESTYNPGKPNKESGAYGLFQWFDTRKQDFFNFCAEKGYKDTTSVDAQLAFCWHENYPSRPKSGSVPFRDYYLSHKNMTSMESLIWWEEEWERCQGNPKWPCYRSKRETELHRLEELYKSNVKTNNCEVKVGSSNDSSSDNVVCPPTSISGADNINEGAGSSSSDSSNSYGSSGSNEGESYDSSSVVKPVIFGGSWAYFMSQYLCKNGDYLTYAQVWQNPTISKSDKKAKYFGELSTNQQAERVSTMDTIKDYLSKNTAPSYIILSIDLAGEWRIAESWQKNYTPANIEYIIKKNLSNKLKKIFSQINHQKVFIPLLVESYCNEVEFCKVRDNSGKVIKIYNVNFDALNAAILDAAKNYKNIKVLKVNRVSNMGTPWRLPSNGYNAYFRQEQWEEYANNVQKALLQNL